MKSEELRSIQAPIKARYREEPESAIITHIAEGELGMNISCKVETGRALVEAGLHPASGGTGLLICSGEMLLEALVACAGVTMSSVATAIGIELKSGKIKAEGDIDYRGTMAVSKEVPVGFRAIRLHFYLETDATEEQVRLLAKLTERYCIVYQTLTKGVSVDTSYHH